MNNRVSFIIPARNEDPSIVAATVEGILTTAPDSWREIVVVDDASSQPIDVSGPGVILMRNQEPLGATLSRHVGTQATSGDVLVWVDAHMTFGHGWLDAMLAEVDSGALLCAPWRDYERARVRCWGSDFGWREERDYARGASPGIEFSRRQRPPRGRAVSVPMVIGACYMMKRDAYVRAGGFCPLFRIYGGDEADLSARSWLSGGSVRCVTGAEVGHLDRTRFPYTVSFDHVEFNQLVMIRSLFEEPTVRVLEEFFYPLPETVVRWLAETDIAGWRSEFQARRRMSDAEFFRSIAPRVPVSFGQVVRIRRGHVPSCRIHARLASEEYAYAQAKMLDVPGESLDRAMCVSTNHKLIRAAVVGWAGRAIILPGGADTGGRALAAELVRAGATLYSLSFAVLDPDGRIHPYPRLNSDPSGGQPLPVGVVANMRVLPGRTWWLRPTAPADAALNLLDNAVGARDEAIFRAVNRAIDGCIALQGRRGSPRAVARALLRHITPLGLHSGSAMPARERVRRGARSNDTARRRRLAPR